MPKTKISEYSATAADNTDIGGINIAEGMAPSDVNNAMREQMAQLKEFLDGSSGDTITTAKIVATTATILSGASVTGTATFNSSVVMSSSVSLTTPLSMASGGTGANLVDPNADRILFWDDSAGAMTFLTAGTGLSITNTTLTATGSGGTVTSVSGTGTVNGITLTGTVTSSGNLTLGGTLSGVSLTTQVTGTLPVANGGTGVTSSTGTGSVVLSASPTFTGTVTTAAIAMADNLLTRSVLKDYAVEGSAIGNTGGTRTLDLTVANFFSATLNQACTFTFSNPPASGDFGTFVLELTNGGAFTITWPASVDWVGGTAPTLTSSGKDQLVFTTRDGGTIWLGFVAGLDIK